MKIDLGLEGTVQKVPSQLAKHRLKADFPNLEGTEVFSRGPSRSSDKLAHLKLSIGDSRFLRHSTTNFAGTQQAI
jgi:hypothetical protein